MKKSFRPLDVDKAIQELFEEINNFETSLCLDHGYILKLKDDSDEWAFIIKVHALVDAALTTMLTVYFENEDLKSIFEKMPFQTDTGVSKIKFSKAFGLLSDTNVNFVTKLCEIRNKFAHNIQFIGKSITYYIETLDKHQKKNFINAICSADKSEHDKTADTNNAIDDIKFHLWFSFVKVFFSIWINIRNKKFEIKERELHKEAHEILTTPFKNHTI